MEIELETNSSAIDEHFKFVFKSFGSSCVNDAMQYALIGGKKLRGYLVNQSSKLFEVDLSKSIWAACSIEALHAYSLVHDDLPIGATGKVLKIELREQYKDHLMK